MKEEILIKVLPGTPPFVTLGMVSTANIGGQQQDHAHVIMEGVTDPAGEVRFSLDE